jgi:hypothetical protein
MTTIEEVTRDYCKQHSLHEPALSQLDHRIIKGILRVKESYAEQLKKRHCTILLSKPPESFESKNETSIKIEPKQRQKQSEEIQMCKAITMKGSPCKAKAKPGCEFCGKHFPK